MRINRILALLLSILIGNSGLSAAPSENKTEQQHLIKSIPAMVEKLKKKPNNYKLQYELGKAFYFDKKYDEALEHLRIANEEPNPAVLKLLANVYKAKKDYLQVIRAYEILLSSKPNDFASRVELADAYVESNKLDLAIENYKKALKTYPKYRDGYKGLLNVYSIRKNTYESRQLALEMERFFPEDPGVLSLICRFYALDNFFERGIQICASAMTADAKNADNMVYLGLMQQGISDGKKGFEILIRAAKKYPKSEFAQMTAARANDAIKNWEASTRYYRQAIAITPRSGPAWLGMATSQFFGDSYEQALKTFQEACKYERKAYGELVKCTGLLLSKKKDAWYTKYREAQDRCGLERSQEKN